MPLLLAQLVLGKDTFDQIKIRTTSVAKTTSVAVAVKEALRVLRELPDDTLDDFRIETQSVSALPSLGTDPRLARAVHSNVVEFEQAAWEEMALSLRQAGRTFTLLLSAAAAVSLLVGGIGVMNIMLVSVAARTREIGLRMAMGARVNDVMIQFMVEAITLAALGGVVGLVLGSLGLFGAEYGLNWATAISPTMLLLAVLMAAATGMIFGYGPAKRAANLDPVVALKSE
jgi:ABC-type lipoprotein release transport system permease subunit